MKLYTDKGKCCGCTACKAVCPKKAIHMQEDEEGFEYPRYHLSLCTNCGLCRKICPMKNDYQQQKELEQPLVYAVKHKNEKVRWNSRSGGVFTAISDYILEKKGVIYGCALDRHFMAAHMEAHTKAERDRFRGSKYVQSRMGDVFTEVKRNLQEGRYVLFTGTSCQIAGLKNYLAIGCNCEKLLLADIVCYGVPSPRIWREYLDYIERKYKGKVTRVEFRNKKKYGWASHVETISIDGKEHDSKRYSNLFLNGHLMRPSCYSCPYKSMKHPGDITLADYWGIEAAMPEFSDDIGISLLLINNEKGKQIFDQVADRVEYRLSDTANCQQYALKQPLPEPVDRKNFWWDYDTMRFSELLKKYTRVKWRILFKGLIKDSIWSLKRLSFTKDGKIKVFR